MNVMNTEVWEPLGWVVLIIHFGPAEHGDRTASRKKLVESRKKTSRYHTGAGGRKEEEKRKQNQRLDRPWVV